MVIEIDGFPLYSFFNIMLNELEAFNTTFVATGILSGLMIHLLQSMTAGNFQVGFKIPFLMTLHPMV